MRPLLLTVVCEQPLSPNLRARLRQRHQALASKRHQEQRKIWQQWDEEAEADAAQRRQAVAEDLARRRQAGGAWGQQRQQYNEAYQFASQQAQQAQSVMESQQRGFAAEIRDRARRRQDDQSRLIPESYAESVVKEQRERARQAAAAAQQAQQAAQQGPSAWDAFVGGRVADKFAKYSQMVNGLQRAHEGLDPYAPRRPRAPSSRAARSASASTGDGYAAAAPFRQAQAQGWRAGNVAEQPQKQWWQQMGEGATVEAAGGRLVRMPWADAEPEPSAEPPRVATSYQQGIANGQVTTQWAAEVPAAPLAPEANWSADNVWDSQASALASAAATGATVAAAMSYQALAGQQVTAGAWAEPAAAWASAPQQPDIYGWAATGAAMPQQAQQLYAEDDSSSSMIAATAEMVRRTNGSREAQLGGTLGVMGVEAGSVVEVEGKVIQRYAYAQGDAGRPTALGAAVQSQDYLDW